MLDVVKKTILAEIGATVTTKEKVEVALKELVDKGRITAKDAGVIGKKLSRAARRNLIRIGKSWKFKFRIRSAKPKREKIKWQSWRNACAYLKQN